MESGIGRSHNIALSTLENFSLPGDVSASKRYWKEDVIEPEVEVSRDGFIQVRDEAGTARAADAHARAPEDAALWVVHGKGKGASFGQGAVRAVLRARTRKPRSRSPLVVSSVR